MRQLWKIKIYSSPLFIFVVLSALTSTFAIYLDFIQLKADFNDEAARFYRVINERTNQNETVLNGFAALMNVLEKDDYEKLRPYAREMLKTYPHIFELGNVARVGYSDVEKFESKMRLNKYRDFKIKEFDFDNDRRWMPVGKRQIYYPIVFLEPELSQNVPNLIGMDVGVSKGFKSALQKAIDTGEIVASKSFSRIEGGRGYVLFKATYQTINPPSTTEARRTKVDRVASLLVRGEYLVKQEEIPSGYNVIIYNTENIPRDIEGNIFKNISFESSDKPKSRFPRLEYSQEMNNSGQPFIIKIIFQTGFEQIKNTSLALSIAFSLLMSISFFFYSRRKMEKASSLRAVLDERKRTKVTLESISDAVITVDINGVIKDVNPAGCRLLKNDISQLKEQKLKNVLILSFEDSDETFAYDFKECLIKQTQYSYNNSLVLRVGERQIAIEDIASPMISLDGSTLGVALVLRDVSQQRMLTGKLEYQATHDP
ncbi:MAG: CHASE domain-containing protein [Deltaproteobacteria bacterium]|nr:CHASE domain-containing protein [Deltaproteobacteria bacterium]